MKALLKHIARLLCASVCLFATTEVAMAEPISIITSILTYLGVNGTVASVVANIIVIAAGVVLAMFLTPKPPKPEGGTISVQQDNPPIIFIYGEEVRQGGALALKDAIGDDLYIIQALAGHQVQFTGTYYYNDDRFLLSGGIRSGGPIGLDGHMYNDARIDTREGLPTETRYDGVPLSIWPENARGDSTASMMSRCPAGRIEKFTAHYPVGQPDPSTVISGTMIFDPRDEDQLPTDQTTFKFASLGNVALGIIHFYCFSPYGPQKDYAKCIEPWLDQWLEEINLCDDFVPKKIGTERRYQMAGWSTTEKDERSVIKTMRESCDGKLIELGDGGVRLWVGVFREAEFTLTDADIIDFKVSIGRTQPSSGNSFTLKYTSHDNDWTTVPTDPIEWLEDQLAWGTRQPVTWEREWVFSTGQASRLLKRGYLKEKQSVRGSMRLHWSGLAAAYERNVKISSNTLPPRLRDATIEIIKAVISPMTAMIMIDWVLTGAEIDDYDPEADESDPAPVPAKPAKVAQYVPANVAAFAFYQASSSFISVDVSFDTPEVASSPGSYRNLDYVVRWRIQDIGGGNPGPWNEQRLEDLPDPTSGRTHIVVAVVPDNVVLELEVRSLSTSKHTPSDWSDTVEVDTSSASVAPGIPHLSVSGTASVDLVSANTTSINLASVEFWRGEETDDFDDAVSIYVDTPAAIGGTSEYSDNPPAGTYKYWATSLNSDGTASGPDGPHLITIGDALGAGGGNTLGAGGGNIIGVGSI